jgi:hypothetical protein
MAREADAALQAKILQIGFVVVFLAAVVYGVRGMMFGSRSVIGLVGFCALGAAAVFMLDNKFWLACPALSVLGFQLPGLPFNGSELGCLLVSAVYFVRVAIRRDRPPAFNRDLLVFFPLVLWIFAIFCSKPTGLVIFGSQTIGGRFYFEILIGVIALVALSAQRIDESGARILFYVLLASLTVSLVKGVLIPTETAEDAVSLLGAEPEVHSRYALIGCVYVYTLLFSRYSLSQVMHSASKVVLFCILGMLTIYSGKRRAFGTLALVPLFRTILTKRDRFLTMAMAVLAAFFLCLAAMGDGRYYDLPWSAKRALAVVFPKYKERTTGGLQDYFREQMREQARVVIRENPWFGRRGFSMRLDEIQWIKFGGGLTNLYAGHAYSGNWHSTWYAYAADFGLPCVLFFAVFFLYVLRYAWIGSREVVAGTFLPACCLYYSLSLFVSAAFSYTSGHSAKTMLSTCIMYGMLLAIVRGYRESRSAFPA